MSIFFYEFFILFLGVMISLSDVFRKIMIKEGVTSYKDLAKNISFELDDAKINSRRLSDWKRNNTCAYELIVFCIRKEYSLDEIFQGNSIKMAGNNDKNGFIYEPDDKVRNLLLTAQKVLKSNHPDAPIALKSNIECFNTAVLDNDALKKVKAGDCDQCPPDRADLVG